MSSNHTNRITEQLEHLQLVPVVSLPSVESGLRLAEILLRCNLPVMEVTFRTPCAAEAIARIGKEHNDLLLIAGTVLTEKQLAAACDAGAECIVLPGVHAGLIESCLARQIMVCPGVATPSEALLCKSLGLHFLKFFPAEAAGGIDMLKAMAAVFGDIRFMPTGGISPANLADYLALDSVFCCGGSWLAPQKLMEAGEWGEIAKRITSARSLLGKANRNH